MTEEALPQQEGEAVTQQPRRTRRVPQYMVGWWGPAVDEQPAPFNVLEAGLRTKADVAAVIEAKGEPNKVYLLYRESGTVVKKVRTESTIKMT